MVVGTIWYILFNQFVGPIPYLLQLAHGPDIPWLTTPGTALFGLVVSDVWEWTPLMALLLLSGLQAIPNDMVEAAMVDGASGFKLFRFITLPQIAAMMAVAVGLRFMDAFRELDKVIIMTGGGPGTATDFLQHAYLPGRLQILHVGLCGRNRCRHWRFLASSMLLYFGRFVASQRR